MYLPESTTPDRHSLALGFNLQFELEPRMGKKWGDWGGIWYKVKKLTKSFLFKTPAGEHARPG